jgi:hypothetical protein
VIHCNLGDAAVDRTANSLAGPAQIEVDSRGIRPGFGTAFQIILNIKMFPKKAPLALITCSLQQLKLMKARQNRFVSFECTLEYILRTTGAIAKNVDPHGCINQNHPRNFRISL